MAGRRATRGELVPTIGADLLSMFESGVPKDKFDASAAVCLPPPPPLLFLAAFATTIWNAASGNPYNISLIGTKPLQIAAQCGQRSETPPAKFCNGSTLYLGSDPPTLISPLLKIVSTRVARVICHRHAHY